MVTYSRMRRQFLQEHRGAASAWATLLVCLAALCTACGASTIPNTQVPDTVFNRDVLAVLEQYRNALNERDVPALLRLTHPQYYDDNGTPGADDDIDYDFLVEKLGLWADRLEDVRYDIRYRDVTTAESGRVIVDYTYTGRFKLIRADGDTRWSRRLDSNRIVLEKVEDQYRIISGM